MTEFSDAPYSLATNTRRGLEDAQNKYDSGRPTIPVLHPNGDVHEVDTQGSNLADLHKKLSDSGYALGGSHQPTAEGAVENSEDFKQHARQAWEKIGNGTKHEESGFWTGATGHSIEYPGTTEDESGHGHIREAMAPSAMGAAHVHNTHLQDDPSKNDIQQAKTAHKNIWVVSRGGLYNVDPSGEVHHLYSSPDWMKTKKKK